MNEQELFYHLKHNLETLYERIDRQNMSQSEYEAHQAHISNLELVLEVLEHRDGDNKLEVLVSEKALWKSGHMLKALKTYRIRTGLDLITAKRIMERECNQ